MALNAVPPAAWWMVPVPPAAWWMAPDAVPPTAWWMVLDAVPPAAWRRRPDGVNAASHSPRTKSLVLSSKSYSKSSILSYETFHSSETKTLLFIIKSSKGFLCHSFGPFNLIIMPNELRNKVFNLANLGACTSKKVV